MEIAVSDKTLIKTFRNDFPEGYADRRERTHSQMLGDASKNPALARIATGDIGLPAFTSLSQAYTLEAEAAEALAIELRRLAKTTAVEHKHNHHFVQDVNTFANLELDVSPGSPFTIGSAGDLTPLQHQDAAPHITQRTTKAATLVSRDETAESLSRRDNDSRDYSDIDFQPLAMIEHPQLDLERLSSSPGGFDVCETFSWELLVTILGGVKWSPGFYWTAPSCSNSRTAIDSYYLIDPEFEPFLPSRPGAHGAKLVPFFHTTPDKNGDVLNDKAYNNAPLFISRPTTSPFQTKEYIYYGTYSQLRFSDRLSHDHQTLLIPASIKQSWANDLSSRDRPDWVTNALMEHFWPKPTYTGPTTASDSEEDDKAARKVDRALKRFLRDMSDWDKEARLKVSFLQAKDVMNAFEEADAAAEPGLRLWWGYLYCVGWDSGLYDRLVEAKKSKAGAVGEPRDTSHQDQELVLSRETLGGVVDPWLQESRGGQQERADNKSVGTTAATSPRRAKDIHISQTDETVSHEWPSAEAQRRNRSRQVVSNTSTAGVANNVFRGDRGKRPERGRWTRGGGGHGGRRAGGRARGRGRGRGRGD